MDWREWQPNKLKTKKHNALQTTPVRSSSAKDKLNAKLSDVIDARKELINMQKSILEDQCKHNYAEQDFLAKERKLKLQLLEVKVEESKLNIALIRKQLLQ